MGVLGLKGKALYRVSRFGLKSFARLYLNTHWNHAENVPREGPVILAANHMSHLDPPLVGCGIPRYCFYMAKVDLYSNPAMRWWLNEIGTISVDRRGGGREALDQARDYLDQDEAVVIFPEGTRSRGTLQQGKSGVVVLALDSGAPIVPIGISGTEEAMGKGQKKIKPAEININYGEPFRIEPPEEHEGDRYPTDFLRDRTKFVMSRIAAQLPEKYLPENLEELLGEYAGDLSLAPAG